MTWVVVAATVHVDRCALLPHRAVCPDLMIVFDLMPLLEHVVALTEGASGAHNSGAGTWPVLAAPGRKRDRDTPDVDTAAASAGKPLDRKRRIRRPTPKSVALEEKVRRACVCVFTRRLRVGALRVTPPVLGVLPAWELCPHSLLPTPAGAC